MPKKIRPDPNISLTFTKLEGIYASYLINIWEILEQADCDEMGTPEVLEGFLDILIDYLPEYYHFMEFMNQLHRMSGHMEMLIKIFHPELFKNKPHERRSACQHIE